MIDDHGRTDQSENSGRLLLEFLDQNIARQEQRVREAKRIYSQAVAAHRPAMMEHAALRVAERALDRLRRQRQKAASVLDLERRRSRPSSGTDGQADTEASVA